MQLLNIFHYYFIVNRNSLQIPNSDRCICQCAHVKKIAKNQIKSVRATNDERQKKFWKYISFCFKIVFFVCVIFQFWDVCLCVKKEIYIEPQLQQQYHKQSHCINATQPNHCCIPMIIIGDESRKIVHFSCFGVNNYISYVVISFQSHTPRFCICSGKMFVVCGVHKQ